jgi:hypothetical protein
MQLPVEAAWVKPYIGIPYSDDGMTLESCNCWNLDALVLKKQFNIYLPLQDAGATDNAKKMNFEQFCYYAAGQARLHGWKQVNRAGHRKADLVLAQRGKDRLHTGLIVCKNIVLHTLENTGSFCEDLRALRVLAVYRHE